MAGSGSGSFVSGERWLDENDLTIEFLMNALRLTLGFPPELFESRTGLPLARLHSQLQQAADAQLIETVDGRIRATPKGYAFLNDVLGLCADSQTAHAG